MIFNQELESQVLAGLICNPNSYYEVAEYIKREDFHYEVNETLFIVIKGMLDNREPLDRVILSARLLSLGLTFKDAINPVDYVESICMNKVSPKILFQSVKELKKISLRRNYADSSKRIISKMKDCGNFSHQEIVTFVDKELNKGIEDWGGEDEIIDLFDGLYELIEERGNDPRVEVGIASPYSEFNRMYGGFKPGDVYVFCARPKEGKALWEDTLIPTPTGLRKIKDLKVGDKVYSMDGSETSVVGTRSWKGRQTYKCICNDGWFVYADMAHEWSVKIGKRDYEVFETEFLSNRPQNEVGFDIPTVFFPKNKDGLKIGLTGRKIRFEKADVRDTCCIEVDHPSHMFLCGEGYIPTHNSSFLNNTAFKMSNLYNQKIPCLILDTEMGQDNGADVKFRLASSLTGINPWYFDTGNWSKVEWMAKKIREEKYNGKSLKEALSSYELHYRYLTDASIDKIVSTVKKWYYTKVGRGNPCIIVYDYIKMSNESTKMTQEHQIIGEKVNRLKELVGKEVNAPLLTAVQLNRSADSRNSDRSDTSSAISTSDRILWFASYVGIFRKKTLQEIAEEGENNGTHKLVTLDSRFQGRDAAGHKTLVQKPDGSLTHNFINYDVKYFNVEERLCAEDMYSKMPNQKGVTISPPVLKADTGDQIFD